MDLHYAYLVGCAVFGVIFWLPIYIWRKDLRAEMILMSALTAPLGIVTTFLFLADYWHPVFAFKHFFALEDFIFAFLIGGFSGVAYEAFFGKKIKRQRVQHKRLWGLGVFPFGILWLYIATLLGFISITAAIALLILLGSLLIVYRPDLAPNAFFSALLTAAAMFVTYQLWFLFYPNLIAEWWIVQNLYGTYILGVPIEELMWGAAWGYFAGPVFEFVAGSRYIQKR